MKWSKKTSFLRVVDVVEAAVEVAEDGVVPEVDEAGVEEAIGEAAAEEEAEADFELFLTSYHVFMSCNLLIMMKKRH